MKKVSFLLGVIFILISYRIQAQSQFLEKHYQLTEKRIYLLDVTKSMIGKGEVKTDDIFDDIKIQLKETIDLLDRDDIEIVIIPYTNKPYLDKAIRGRSDFREDIKQKIDLLTVLPGNTNITDAWSAAVQEIDTNKINYLFLITDGLHNVGPITKLYESLKKWQQKSEDKFLYAFYVMLTENAVDEQIRLIADSTSQMWKIKGMNVNVGFLRSVSNPQSDIPCKVYRKNVLHQNTFDIYFSASRKSLTQKPIYIQVEMEDNPYYSLEDVSSFLYGKERGGLCTFRIKKLCEKEKMPLEYAVKLKFEAIVGEDEFPKVFFTPEKVTVILENRGARAMTFKKKKKKLFNF